MEDKIELINRIKNMLNDSNLKGDNLEYNKKEKYKDILLHQNFKQKEDINLLNDKKLNEENLSKRNIKNKNYKNISFKYSKKKYFPMLNHFY